jgi:hypothetical protein
MERKSRDKDKNSSVVNVSSQTTEEKETKGQEEWKKQRIIQGQHKETTPK